MPSRSWLGACKRASWMMHLCGRIWPRSKASRGVKSWIASLRACRASHTASPENGSATPTSDTYGRHSSASWKPCSPPWCSSKTSQPSLPGFDLSESDYRGWVIGLRADYSRRKSAARRNGVLGGSAWPTASASVANDGECVASWEARKQRNIEKHANGNGMGTPLTIAAQLWPTPSGMAGTDATGKPGAGWEFAKMACQWQTPQLPNGGGKKRGARRGGELLLEGQAAMWATPKACDGFKPSAGKRKDADMAHQSLTSLPAPVTEMPGSGSLPSTPAVRRQLNPRFVEWLQGLPSGWVQLESMSFERWETWLSQSRRLLRSLRSGKD